jgi:hypothetical protein
MRKQLLALAILILGSFLNLAAQSAQQATIISHTTVQCGTKNKGKKESTTILCHQYTVHSSTTEFQIRQMKPGQMDILEPNTPIDFTIDKDRMKFKAKGKKYEFLVVGTSAIGANPQPK